MHGALDVEGDRRQPLGERIVDLTSDSGPLLGARQSRRVLRQPGALDGDANLVRDGRQEPQFLRRQLAPLGTRHIHDAERFVLKVERNAGVVAQTGRQRGRLAAKRRLQAAALDNVDVGGRQLAVAKVVDAPAATTTRHAHPFLEVRRQLAFRRVIEAVGVLVQQPDPTRAKAEHVGHEAQRTFQRLANVRRRVQRLRDRVDDTQLALGVHTSVTSGRIIGRRLVRSYTNEFSVSRTLPTR